MNIFRLLAMMTKILTSSQNYVWHMIEASHQMTNMILMDHNEVFDQKMMEWNQPDDEDAEPKTLWAIHQHGQGILNSAF